MHEPVAYQTAQHAPAAPITPTAITPAGATEPMVWVPGPGGDFVAVPRSAVPLDYLRPAPTPARDLTPQPLIDPRAQVLAAGGMCAAGAGWGVGQVISAMAGISSAALLALCLAIVAWRIPKGALQRQQPGSVTHVTHRSVFGRHTTHL